MEGVKYHAKIHYQASQKIYKTWKVILSGILISGWKNLLTLQLVWLLKCQTLHKWRYKNRVTLYKPAGGLLAGFSLLPYVPIAPA